MSMQPVPWPEPDPQITAAIEAMYGSRKAEQPLAVEVRDRLGLWLANEEFAAAFGIRGRPGWAPSRLALVIVLQRAEKLTDRPAADAVRARLDWKYLLGLSLLFLPAVAAGAARRRRAAPGAGAELHPGYNRRQGGDQAAARR